MNINKRSKPNLVDENVGKKIVNILKPEQVQYWEPTKNTFKSFYEKYIKTNTGLIILIIFVILFLIYRYRIIKKNREAEEIEKIYNELLNINNNPVAPQPHPSVKPLPTTTTTTKSVPADKTMSQKDIDEYTKMLLQYYHSQKEQGREFAINKKHHLDKMAEKAIVPPLASVPPIAPLSPSPKFAYPIYPYAKGGSFAPTKQ